MPNKDKSSSSSGGSCSSRPGSSSPRPPSEAGGTLRRLKGGGGGNNTSGDRDSPSRGSLASENSEDRDMVGGCCVCSDERGWDENPLVYCDGQGCNVAVHQACYGIVSVPQGPWFCRKCETTERSVRVRCELCPSKEGALKRTDSNSWAHVVCALYIPEVRFGNVSTMEPIVLGLVPQERYLKTCYLCESQGRESKASTGACMQCNRQGCKQSFHVTCAQSAGLLCEEAGNYMDNVKYCGYCQYHYQRINKKIVKTIPAFKPIKARDNASSPETSPEKAYHRVLPGGGGGDADAAGSGSNLAAGGGSNLGGSASSSANFRDAKKGKKGRKPILSSSSSEGGCSSVKIEAAKLLVDTPSSTNSSKPLSDASAAKDGECGEDGGSPGWSSSKSLWPASSSRPQEEEAKTDQGGGEKPPVVLKFGKQDNGKYYNKDVISSSSTSCSSPSASASATSSSGNTSGNTGSGSTSSSSKKEHKDKNHHHHHKKDKRREYSSSSSRQNSPVEADTTSNSSARGSSTPPTSMATSAATTATTTTTTTSVSISVKDSAAAAPSSSSVAPESSSSSIGNKQGSEAATASATDLSSKSNSVKVEPMEVEQSAAAAAAAVEKKLSGNPDLVISTIKTTSCSVSLDKSKVDLKLLRKSDFKTASTSASSFETSSGETSSGGVQLTPLPSKTEASSSGSQGRERAEADTSSKSGVTITAEKASSSDQGGGDKSGNAQNSNVLANSSGVTIEQVSPVKTEDQQQQNVLVSPTTGKMPRMSASGKRIGRPPKKGTHVAINSIGPMRPVSPSSAAGGVGSDPAGADAVKRKRKSPHKRPVNGAENAAWMMGASLNPSSEMAKDMNVALEDEIKAHSAYDPNKDKHYLGVPFPGARRQRAPSSQTHSANDILSAGKSQPQTLEELLERQWEQGSQFLMEQASHFDIASLLSSLHQLKEENVDLEDSVDRLVQRRDHLLAVRARLLALSSLSLSSGPPTPERPAAGSQGGGGTGHHQQNGPSPSSRSAHASPRTSAAATVSPVSIQRAARGGSTEMAAPMQSPRSHHPPAAPAHQLPPGARELPRGPSQLPSPRDSRVSPRSAAAMHPAENGLDYGPAAPPPPPQHQTLPPHPHMSVASASHHHHQQQQAAAAAALHQQRSRGGEPQVNDRIMNAHLLTVVSSTGPSMVPGAPTRVVPASHAPPPPRQSAGGYPLGGPVPPPVSGMMPGGPPRSVAQPLPPGHHPATSVAMVRAPPHPPQGMPPHPPPPHQYGGGGPLPPPGAGYQIVSPPPGHASMVTLDRSSQQHLRGCPPPPPMPQGSQPPPPPQHMMRMDKR